MNIDNKGAALVGACGGVVITGCIIYADLEHDDDDSDVMYVTRETSVTKLGLVETAVGLATIVGLVVYFGVQLK